MQQGYVVAQIDDRTSSIWGHRYAALGDHDIGPVAAKDHEVAVAPRGCVARVLRPVDRLGQAADELHDDSCISDETWAELAAIYDREVKDAVKRALGLLEPIVTVLLGLTVGGVAVLVITTIYSAMRGLGR